MRGQSEGFIGFHFNSLGNSVSGFLADELTGQILIDGGPTGPGFPGGCDQGSTWVLTCA